MQSNQRITSVFGKVGVFINPWGSQGFAIPIIIIASIYHYVKYHVGARLLHHGKMQYHNAIATFICLKNKVIICFMRR